MMWEFVEILNKNLMERFWELDWRYLPTAKKFLERPLEPEAEEKLFELEEQYKSSI